MHAHGHGHVQWERARHVGKRCVGAWEGGKEGGRVGKGQKKSSRGRCTAVWWFVMCE